MDENVLRQLVDYLEEYTGLRSPPANKTHLRRALEKQALQAEIPPEELATRVQRDPAARQALLNSVMIGETYFFREAGQFRLLSSTLLPELSKKRRRISCWSVSCSTGEEAVSLAALLDDHARRFPGLEYTVYASDINTESLEKLHRGVFPRSSLRRDGSDLHPLLIDRHVSESGERMLTVSPALRKRIEVKHLNFFRDDLGSIPAGLDFIFFRNTLLYATTDKRNGIIARIVTRLRPGGYLFLATSELPFASHPELQLREFGGVYALYRPTGEERELPERRRATGRSASEPGTTEGPGTAQGPGTTEGPGTAQGPAPMGDLPQTTPAPVRVTSDTALELLNSGQPLPSAEEHAEPNALAVVAGLVVDCYAAVNGEQLDRALIIADRLCAVAGDTALANYCAGWVHYTAGNREETLAAFDRSLTLDGSFWPARFYRASLSAGSLEAPGPRRTARREFTRCLAAIDQHDESGRSNRFAFLLEGFNAAYFRRMCTRWIEKISEKEPA